MRILQIVADGTPGGGTTNVLALTEDLIAAGDEISFVSQKASYAIAEAAKLGAAVFDEVDFFRGRFNRKIVGNLKRITAEVCPELVHVHGARAALPFIRGQEGQPPLPSVYTVRGYHFLHKPWGWRHLAALAERKISHHVNRTVHVCFYDQELGARWHLIPEDRPSRVIYNGIYTKDIPEVAPDASHKEVAVLGRLTYQKNPGLVLEIAKTLKGEGYRFHLIGGGDLYQSLKRKITTEQIENVVLHGALPRAKALTVMAQCGTFLLASRWEGLPIAPVEAMQMGLAVIVSDVSGNREIVDDGVNGLLVNAEDHDEYIRAFRRLDADSDQRARFNEAGRSVVTEKFTRDNVTRNYRLLYQELLQGNLTRSPL